MPGQSGGDEDVATVPELWQDQVDSVEMHRDVTDLRLSDSESLEYVRVELLWRDIQTSGLGRLRENFLVSSFLLESLHWLHVKFFVIFLHLQLIPVKKNASQL